MMDVLKDLYQTYIRETIALEKESRFSLLNDEAIDFLIDLDMRWVLRDGRVYMEVKKAAHIWYIVFRPFPYIPTQEEINQALDLYEYRLLIYNQFIQSIVRLLRNSSQ